MTRMSDQGAPDCLETGRIEDSRSLEDRPADDIAEVLLASALAHRVIRKYLSIGQGPQLAAVQFIVSKLPQVYTVLDGHTRCSNL